MLESEEEVLNGNARRLSGRDGNLDVLLRFDRLMNPFAPFAPFAETARKFVDDNDFAVPNDVLLVEVEFPVDFDRAFDVFVDVIEPGRLHRFGFGEPARLLASFAREFYFALFVVVGVVFVFNEFVN